MVSNENETSDKPQTPNSGGKWTKISFLRRKTPRVQLRQPGDRHHQKARENGRDQLEKLPDLLCVCVGEWSLIETESGGKWARLRTMEKQRDLTVD